MNLLALQNDVARVGGAVQQITESEDFMGLRDAYTSTEVAAVVMDENTRALYGAAQFHVQRVGFDHETGTVVIGLGAAEAIKGRSLIHKHGWFQGFLVGTGVASIAFWAIPLVSVLS